MSIVVGIDADDRSVKSIESVISGLGCNCICPHCNATLIAHKGLKNKHHFKHYEADEDINCRETALHLAAKRFFLTADNAYIPGVECQSASIDTLLNEPYESESKFFNGLRRIRAVDEEVWFSEYNYRPDIRCEVDIAAAWEPLLIEIAVTHKVDGEKLKKIEASGYSAIEIDLADLLKSINLNAEEIDQALCDPARITWLNKSENLASFLQELTDAENVASVVSRNKEINQWHQQVSQHLLSSKYIQLPKYQFPDRVLAKTIKLKDGKHYPVEKPAAPTIGGTFELVGISKILDSEFELNLKHKGKDYTLPVVLNISAGPQKPPEKSYLIINDVSLPDPRVLVARLRWGSSQKAENYITRVMQARAAVEMTHEDRIEQTVSELRAQYELAQRTPGSVQCRNIHQIKRYFELHMAELSRLNIDAKRYTCHIPDGWLFGCPQEYWQVIVLRSICYVNSDSIGVPFLSDYLKRTFGINAIPLVHQLRVMDTGIKAPNAWSVLNKYLAHLDRCNVLSRGYKEFSKTIIYGTAYRDKVIGRH